MEYQLSPSYSHEKLENPTFSDLVDVLEDLWQNCIFSPARLLLNSPYGEIAAITIIGSYFEAMASYTSGEDSNGRSRKFFITGFCDVFHSRSEEIRHAAAAIYKHIRCGLAHEGMFSYKVSYSRAGAQAFQVTYPKKPDGSLDTNAEVASILFNPVRMYEGVEKHFKNYLAKLRSSEDEVLCEAFQKSVVRLWGLGKGENNAGMTEAEFLGRPNHN